jgi:hypothetical protein
VAEAAGALRTMTPTVVATGGDLQDRAQASDRIVLAVAFNKSVLYLSSLAKYAAAFFKMSISSFARASS